MTWRSHNCPFRFRFGVDDDLIAMPWFDGGDEFLAVLEFALFDFAGAATALGFFLIAGAELRALPFTRRGA